MRVLSRASKLAGALALASMAVVVTGCYAMRPSAGGGETRPTSSRIVQPADIALPDGYKIEVVAAGLTFPTGVTFDDDGRVYVVEAGYSYGEVFTTPRLLRIEPGGGKSVVATGKNPPWTGVAFSKGAFIISEGAAKEGLGRILRVTPGGEMTPLIEGLPNGDHHTNGPVVGPDGWIYFGQGTRTNSGVVGEDNFKMGWAARSPELHDIPCKDIKLSGINYTTPNPLTPDKDDKVATGPYLPFGKASETAQVVPGKVPCSGAIMKVPPEGGRVELVAWGFRNPFGLAFSPDGALYATDNGYDDRGSRPVWGNADWLWQVKPGTWYGWPDHADGRPIAQERYRPQGHESVPVMLLADHPNPPPQPAAFFAVHSSSNGIDFSRSAAFGFMGNAFVAQFGDQAPDVGKVVHPVGYKVVRVDVKTGVIRDFATNFGRDNGPASKLKKGGLERPVSVRFDRDGKSLYVVDFGILQTAPGEMDPKQGTGVLWRITRTGGETG
jgi:glucose/arabinose dehydrogenase